MKLAWPLLMIFCFGVMDMTSTCIVYEHLGTFAYETGYYRLSSTQSAASVPSSG